MPPVTQKAPISAAGQASKERIAQTRALVDAGSTSAEARKTVRAGIAAPRLNPTIPDVIPSTALSGNRTFEDVLDTRADLETTAAAKTQLTEQINGVNNRIGNTGTPIFANTDDMINRLLLNRTPSSREAQRQQAYDTSVENRRDYAGDIATARQDLGQEYGLPDLTTALAGTRTQYAERQNKLDTDLKRLEENATKRGVAREFADAEKNKLKSDALEDLSNLAAIEAAQVGSLNEAKSIINDVISDKKAAFELENQAIEQEISYLSTLVGEDNAKEAQQLTFALSERKARQDKMLADEQTRKEYMVEAASNGADDGTIAAITNATTPEEAFRLAAPYIGLMQRRQAEASIRSSNASAASSNTNRLLSLAEKGDANAIQQLGFDPRSTTGNFEAESGLRKEFNALPPIKEAVSVQQSYKSINAAMAEAQNAATRGGSPAAADQALIISFNKMLDPNSVVREGEFARSTQGQAYLQQIQAKVDAALRGGAGLSNEMRQEIFNTTERLYGDYIQTHNDTAYEYRQNALRQGGDPKYVAGYLDTTISPEEAQEGDIIVVSGIPLQKVGTEFVKLDI